MQVCPDSVFVNEKRSEYGELRKPIADEFELKLKNELDRINRSFFENRESQRVLAVNLSRISLSAVLTYCITNLCNTGEHDREAFYKAADKYQSDLEEAVFGATWTDNIKVGENTHSFGGRNRERVKEEDIPQFTYNHLSLNESLSNSWLDLSLLVLFNLVFFAGAYVSFRKYDVS